MVREDGLTLRSFRMGDSSPRNQPEMRSLEFEPHSPPGRKGNWRLSQLSMTSDLMSHSPIMEPQRNTYTPEFQEHLGYKHSHVPGGWFITNPTGEGAPALGTHSAHSTLRTFKTK